MMFGAKSRNQVEVGLLRVPRSLIGFSVKLLRCYLIGILLNFYYGFLGPLICCKILRHTVRFAGNHETTAEAAGVLARLARGCAGALVWRMSECTFISYENEFLKLPD